MKLKLSFGLLMMPVLLWAQTVPKEGSALNYRIVGFSGPELQQGKYEISIAKGNYNTGDSFKKHVFRTLRESNDKLLIEVPAFGSQYTWQVVSVKGGTSAGLHHFSTASIPNADTAKMRLRVIKKAGKYEDGYVFLDGNRALYDMKGQPVWFLPDKEDFQKETLELRDLKLTPQGTITFLLADKPFEVNYNGDILWRGPDNGKVSGANTENYHHEFTRLSNGHYMILGNEFTYWRPDANGIMVLAPKNKINNDSLGYYRRLQMGTLIEYDEKGSVVCSWHLSDYFKGSDLFYHIRPNGTPDIAVHDNGFFFDEKEKVIYLSLRNISRVIKVSYPGFRVLNEYGQKFKPGVTETYNGLFCRQHSCRVSHNGYLYLYNNNLCNIGTMPRLIMMQQPADNNSQPEKIWEYECTVENPYKQLALEEFTIGGNVLELPDGSLFACMGGVYSKVFIINQRKKILWSAVPEKWDSQKGMWQVLYSYRGSMINDRNGLEHLVWGAQ